MDTAKTTKKKIYKRWWFWAIVALIVILVIAGKEPNDKDNDYGPPDKIEVITYAQMAIEEYFPKAVFSKYFDEDYEYVAQVFNDDPKEAFARYKVEGKCRINEDAPLVFFCVIIEFNGNFESYTIDHVNIDNVVYVE